MLLDSGRNAKDLLTLSGAPVRAGDPSPTTLRYIRATGHVCLVGLLTIFVLLFKYRGAPYDQVWHLVLAQLLSGRAGSTGLGLQKGINHYYLFFQISMQDFIIMLYVYPWFVTGYQHLSRFPVVGPALSGAHELALRHKSRIAPYGSIGLILFVLFPFWSTGPLVGVLVGYLIGLRTWATFASVIAGNLAAVSAWILFYDRLNTYSPKAALVFLIAVFVLVTAGTFIARFRRTHRQRTLTASPGASGSEAPKPQTAAESMVSIEPDPARGARMESESSVRDPVVIPCRTDATCESLARAVDSNENRAAG